MPQELVYSAETFKTYYRDKSGLYPAVFVFIPYKSLLISHGFLISGKTQTKKFLKGNPDEAVPVDTYVPGAKQIMLNDLKWSPLDKTHWWYNFDHSKRCTYLVIQKVES